LESWDEIPETDGEPRLIDREPWVGISLTGTRQIGLLEKNALRYLIRRPKQSSKRRATRPALRHETSSNHCRRNLGPTECPPTLPAGELQSGQRGANHASMPNVFSGSEADEPTAGIFRPDCPQKRTSLMRPSTSDLCQVQTPGSWLDHMVPAARAPANMLAFNPDQPDIRRGGGWNS
jgi:hypothetical protein